MRAYLIDPGLKTVTLVDYTGDYKNIYTHIGCDTFDAIQINDNQDTIYVDDEGLLKGPTSFFMVQGRDEPLAGKGLVLGTNEDGDSVEPKLTLEEVTAMVEFGLMLRANSELVWLSADGSVRRIA